MSAGSTTDDEIARILRDHYQTEVADAGLRSIDLSGVGGGVRDPESGITDRRSRREGEHRGVRKALALLDTSTTRILWTAYGEPATGGWVPTRQHGKRERPPDRERVRENFPGLGKMAGLAGLTRGAARAAEHWPSVHAWLISPGPREAVDTAATPKITRAQAITEEALEMLRGARAAFAKAYQPTRGPRLDAQPSRRLRRNLKADLIKSLAFGGADGQVIARLER